ncbi:MAG TPA: hypothetical protein GX505_12485 [Clostridiales bacterium]|nr:hypothetical protein [Clostridiales bacterium]
MKASEILNHFLGLADWVDRSNTVDKIIIGDPEKEISRILVSLYVDRKAIKHAIDNGFDMIITHEPTFWFHANEVENVLGMEDGPRKKACYDKMKLINDNGLVIMRNHDVWDRMPRHGIPWAWADFLGLKGEPAAIGAAGYQHRYDIEPVSLDAFARAVAQRTAAVGEPAVQAIGDGNRIISKIGIGTGCCCTLEAFIEMGCDAAIVTDDGFIYWEDIKWAMDIDFPLIRVNHATSEEAGMITLTRYINESLSGVKAVHLPHVCGIRVITGSL